MDKFFIIFLFFAMTLLSTHSYEFDSCGKTEFSKGLIYGGAETVRGEFPFLCALYHIEFNKLFCGATLISSKHVITGKKHRLSRLLVN